MGLIGSLMGGALTGRPPIDDIEIKGAFKTQELRFVKSMRSLDWDLHPVRLLSLQAKHIDWKLVFPILQGKNLKPSFLAKLNDKEPLDPIIQAIDDLYVKTAIPKYQERGLNACAIDKETIENLSTPQLPPAAGGGTITATVVNTLSGWVGTGRLSPEEVARQGSSRRISWFHSIEEGEKDRLTNTRNLIVEACLPLVSALAKLEQTNQTQTDKVKLLWQLSRIYTALNREPLTITLLNSKSINVATYVVNLHKKFPQLRNLSI